MRTLPILRRFLNENDDFAFDPEEYFHSVSVSDQIRERNRMFHHLIEDGANQDAALDSGKILAARAGTVAYSDPRHKEATTKTRLRMETGDFTNMRHKEMGWEKATSGTSGRPISILYDKSFYCDMLTQGIPRSQMAYFRNVDRSDGLYALAISDLHYVQNTVFLDPLEETGFTAQIQIGAGEPGMFERCRKLIEEYRPLGLSTKPSVLRKLLESKVFAQAPDSLGLKFILLGGQETPAALRNRAEDTFGCPILNVYGMTEFGVIAHECPAGRLHIDATAVHVENWPEFGRELIVSTRQNMLMPLAHYRTGDHGRVAKMSCPCGRSGWSIEDFEGRRVPAFLLSSGETLSPTIFNDLFARYPTLREYQITQLTLEKFLVRTQWNAEDAGAAADLVRHVTTTLGGMDVLHEVFDLEAMPKYERYRSDVGGSS